MFNQLNFKTMKKVKISISMAMIAVAIMLFGGCDKDTGTPALVSGKFSGRVTATIESPPSELTAVAPWGNFDGLECDNSGCVLTGGRLGENVDISNTGRFTVNLPASPPSSFDMIDIQDVLEEHFEISGKLNYSDPYVQVMEAVILTRTSQYWVGEIVNATQDRKTFCFYVYAEEDLTVTGSIVSIKFEEGWNRVYATVDGKGKLTKLTTKEVEGLKWYFEGFEED